jgi:heterodisulfide reductase subunit A2
MCSGCRICNGLCPFNAIAFLADDNVSEINPALCQGCGTCVAACPAGAISGTGFSNEQIIAQIDGLLMLEWRDISNQWKRKEWMSARSNPVTKNKFVPRMRRLDYQFEPTIIGFTCNWCSYRASDLAGTARMKYAPNVRLIRLMCSGRLDPTFVLRALSEGAQMV